MAKRIFIIDDEPDMVKIGTDLLEAEGYLVSSSQTPSDALRKIRANLPDLILLDVRLPEMDGYHVCKELKADPHTKNVPIIMISVKADESDVVVGLEFGAEDYITKPLRKRELLARVRTVLRRLEPDAAIQKIECGPIAVDYASYIATVNNKKIDLTPKEFELLGFFLKRKNRVVTRAVMSESVWGIEFTGSTRTIDVHVDQLRKKLGRYGSMITGLKGIGYRFELDE